MRSTRAARPDHSNRDPAVWSFDQAQSDPAGSRLFGDYSSDVAIGQGRILVAWTRLVTPDGQSVQMEAFGGDAQGRSASPARPTPLRCRFGIGCAHLPSRAAPAVAAAKYTDEISSDTVESMGEDLSAAMGSAVEAYTSLPPIITVAPGAAITVMVDRDLENLVMDDRPSFLGTYLTPIAPLFMRDDLVEVAINPDGKVWIERKGAAHMERVAHLSIDRVLSTNLGQA